ncbi:MAG: DUF3090 family protein [Anaerolineae bacterium]|nr:DUF3090 family protein [Anaerolineae bacterium]
MENEIVLDPVEFITVGTVGPKGRRIFYLQGGKGPELISLTIEKQQAQALGEAIVELLDSLHEKYPDLSEDTTHISRWNMDLRDPIDSLFRVAQMGLGYDEERNMVMIVAQELVISDESLPEPSPQIVRFFATCEQMRALSEHAARIVQQGRADPKTNGFMIYYWT